jgi:hypothetical protein
LQLRQRARPAVVREGGDPAARADIQWRPSALTTIPLRIAKRTSTPAAVPAGTLTQPAARRMPVAALEENGDQNDQQYQRY